MRYNLKVEEKNLLRNGNIDIREKIYQLLMIAHILKK